VSVDESVDDLDLAALLPKKIAMSSVDSLPETELDDGSESKNSLLHTKKSAGFHLQIDDKRNLVTRNLHVSGFGAGTTKEQVSKLFKAHANVIGVVQKGTVPKSFDSYAFSYMFVNTASRDDAMRARERLSGKVLNGGTLKINFAKE
jgi:RNA recognition motif-containing protein